MARLNGAGAAMTADEVGAVLDGPETPQAEETHDNGLAVIEAPEKLNGAMARAEHRDAKERLSAMWGVSKDRVVAVLIACIVKERDDQPPPTADHIVQCGAIASAYNLNPLTNQVYFFMSRDRRRVVPVVGVDGWAAVVARHPEFNGASFDAEVDDGGKLRGMSCTLWRKGCDHPVVVTEYLAECKGGSKPWQSHPWRMLRHKSFIQCARLAFALTGLYDEDEARAAAGWQHSDGTPILASRTGADKAAELNASIDATKALPAAG